MNLINSSISKAEASLQKAFENIEDSEEVVNEHMKQLKENSLSIGESKESFYFDDNSLHVLINVLLSDEKIMREGISAFAKYLKLGDVKFFTLKIVQKLIKQKKAAHPDGDISQVYSENFAQLITSVKLPVINGPNGTKNLKNLKLYCGSSGWKFHYPIANKMFNDIWSIFLTFSNTFNAYKKILSVMDTQILPHHNKPLSLADFLINSYNLGGSVALLSLSSLFHLMTQYNLEYENFFENFYSLISLEILYVKYRSRFLYWTDIFLSSTNIPSYLAASFVKKLCRLVLIAPLDAQLVLIPLIGNVLVRHPKLHMMVNRTEQQDNDIVTDPFDFEQQDPKLSNALESSLWEIKALQNHWHLKVRKAAKFINKPIPKEEWDLSDLLEITFSDLVEEEFMKDLPEDDIEFEDKKKETLLSLY